MPTKNGLTVAMLVNTAAAYHMTIGTFKERDGPHYVAVLAPSEATLQEIIEGFMADDATRAEHTNTYPLTEWYPIAYGNTVADALAALDIRLATIPSTDLAQFMEAMEHMGGIIDLGDLKCTDFSKAWTPIVAHLFTRIYQTVRDEDSARINFTDGTSVGAF